MDSPDLQSSVSVVIPVYNSSETLLQLFSRIKEVMKKLSLGFEIIFINDGSSDQSWYLIRSLVINNPGEVVGINLAMNYGQHNATLCGFNYCKHNRIITIDDDLQFQPEDIGLLIANMEETNADIVYGKPSVKQHEILRIVGTRLADSLSFNQSARKSSSFRLIRSRIVKEIINNPYHQKSLFLDLVMGWHTSFISTVRVSHFKRNIGKSNYSLAKLFRLYFEIIISYTAFPLKAITYIGLAGALITLVIGIRFIIRKLTYDVPLGYTSIIVSILFSTSIILCSLGIIGQYLFRLYMLQCKKPSYSVDKVVR